MTQPEPAADAREALHRWYADKYWHGGAVPADYLGVLDIGYAAGAADRERELWESYYDGWQDAKRIWTHVAQAAGAAAERARIVAWLRSTGYAFDDNEWSASKEISDAIERGDWCTTHDETPT